MPRLALTTEVVDREAYANSVRRLREAGVVLPTFAELADPATIPGEIAGRLAGVDPDSPHPLNLFRIHWHNRAGKAAAAALPDHLVLPGELTGVAATIVMLLGDRFPMIRAHKVLASYGCLAPRLVTGQFDPTRHRAVWPSTGNYCRGGVAVSRIMGCRSAAVLPQGMSRERFEWLARWVAHPDDVIRTPGSESNVWEIYRRCAELERDDADDVIFNQFSEFGNHLAHYLCTGRAAERVFEALRRKRPELRLAAFVAATGSAGTLAAGDHLKERYGCRIAAAEALECPTMLYGGFGEHNIQGIGDKHIPLIHNVMNTDFVVAVSDAATDRLNVLFNSAVGRSYLARRRRVADGVVAQLGRLGLSSICNLVAAIKVARYLGLGGDEVLMTVATDGSELYPSEGEKTLERDFPAGFDEVAAGETCGRYLLGAGTEHLLELTSRDRERIFDLGYFTWVEQQGLPVEEFVARRHQGFWRGLRSLLPAWDERIAELNRASRATAAV
jgi:cysteine synthase